MTNWLVPTRVPPVVRSTLPTRARTPEGELAVRQCAAVTTQSSRISEPPQKWLPLVPWRETMNG